MKSKNVSVRKIAKLCGKSPATVSKALNNQIHEVSLETQKKIVSLAKKLGYQPYKYQQYNNTRNIGFILSERSKSSVFADYFYSRLLNGIEPEIKQNGYNLLYYSIKENFNKSSQVPKILSNRICQGLLVTAWINKHFVEYIKERKYHAVLIDSIVEDKEFDSIVIDNVKGAYEAVKYLITLGHKNIAYVGASINFPPFSERLQGYRIALSEFNIPYHEGLVKFGDVESGYELMKKVLNNVPRPTAVFCCNDANAILAMKAIYEIGLTVPKDISIVGFDDIDISSYSIPTLTTIRVPIEQMGKLAVKKLIESVEDNDHIPTKTVVSTELVIRDSCAKL